METMIQSVKIYSEDVGMEFGIGKRHITEGIQLPNQEKIRMFGEKATYKYLGILEADTIKQEEIKEKMKKRLSQEDEKTTRNQTI